MQVLPERCGLGSFTRNESQRRTSAGCLSRGPAWEICGVHEEVGGRLEIRPARLETPRAPGESRPDDSPHDSTSPRPPKPSQLPSRYWWPSRIASSISSWLPRSRHDLRWPRSSIRRSTTRLLSGPRSMKSPSTTTRSSGWSEISAESTRAKTAMNVADRENTIHDAAILAAGTPPARRRRRFRAGLFSGRS